jgi:hypothetical protein
MKNKIAISLIFMTHIALLYAVEFSEKPSIYAYRKIGIVKSTIFLSVYFPKGRFSNMNWKIYDGNKMPIKSGYINNDQDMIYEKIDEDNNEDLDIVFIIYDNEQKEYFINSYKIASNTSRNDLLLGPVIGALLAVGIFCIQSLLTEILNSKKRKQMLKSIVKNYLSDLCNKESAEDVLLPQWLFDPTDTYMIEEYSREPYSNVIKDLRKNIKLWQSGILTKEAFREAIGNNQKLF